MHVTSSVPVTVLTAALCLVVLLRVAPGRVDGHPVGLWHSGG